MRKIHGIWTYLFIHELKDPSWGLPRVLGFSWGFPGGFQGFFWDSLGFPGSCEIFCLDPRRSMYLTICPASSKIPQQENKNLMCTTNPVQVVVVVLVKSTEGTAPLPHFLRRLVNPIQRGGGAILYTTNYSLPLMIFTSFLKNQFGKIKCDGLDFLVYYCLRSLQKSILKLIFAG